MSNIILVEQGNENKLSTACKTYQISQFYYEEIHKHRKITYHSLPDNTHNGSILNCNNKFHPTMIQQTGTQLFEIHNR